MQVNQVSNLKKNKKKNKEKERNLNMQEGVQFMNHEAC